MKKLLIGGMFAIALGAIAYAQGFNFINPLVQGHLLSGLPQNATAPSVTNAALQAGSNDLAGTVTSSGASSPVLTFGTAFNQIPFCTITNQGEAETPTYAVTKTTITFTGLTNGAIGSYVCVGSSGN